MSTQQDIYAAGSENRPPMLNKENYVPWSSRLLWYAKSRPNGKLIYNSIMNGPYVRRMIPETKDLHTTDYTQLYDFLKYNQKEVDDQRAERLAKTHDPLALMANSNNPFNYPVFHQDQPSPTANLKFILDIVVCRKPMILAKLYVDVLTSFSRSLRSKEKRSGLKNLRIAWSLFMLFV
ncbi:hypothetical protein Tco_0273884 [Tanacetum coccineum]